MQLLRLNRTGEIARGFPVRLVNRKFDKVDKNAIRQIEFDDR